MAHATKSETKAPKPSPPAFVDLPATYQPILVDRFVTFLYAGVYASDHNNTSRLLHRTTHIPETSTNASYGCPELDASKFHLHMCALAEDLECPALYDYTYTKLSHVLLRVYLAPKAMKNLIDLSNHAIDPKFRVGKDAQGWIQNLIVASAIVQDHKYWGVNHQNTFDKIMHIGKYEFFWKMHEEIKAANLDVLPNRKKRT